MMRAYHIIKLLETPTDELSWHRNYTKLIDLKIDIENACKRLNIKKPITIYKARKIARALNKSEKLS